MRKLTDSLIILRFIIGPNLSSVHLCDDNGVYLQEDEDAAGIMFILSAVGFLLSGFRLPLD